MCKKDSIPEFDPHPHKCDGYCCAGCINNLSPFELDNHTVQMICWIDDNYFIDKEAIFSDTE